MDANIKKTNQTSNIKVYRSDNLFGSEGSIQINHRGVIYTLRITQFGKLILTK